jgi:hypothetical protein
VTPQLPLLYGTLHWQQLQHSALRHMCMRLQAAAHADMLYTCARLYTCAGALQEELEAYDKHQRKLEDALDQKTAELIALRKAALEHAAVSPMKVGSWAFGVQGIGPKQPPAQSALLSLPGKHQLLHSETRECCQRCAPTNACIVRAPET